MPTTEHGAASSSDAAIGGNAMLSLEDIRKSFGGVEALRGASLAIAEGQITALVGDNGAGKSTLIKTIMGVHQPNSGRITLNGVETVVPDPEAARRLGLRPSTRIWHWSGRSI